MTIPPPTAGSAHSLSSPESLRRHTERHAMAALLPFVPVGQGPHVLLATPGDEPLRQRLQAEHPDLIQTMFSPQRVRWGLLPQDPPPRRVDTVIEADHLPWADHSLSTLIGIDVLARLRRPARLLAEAERVLRRGGRLALVEPWVGLWGTVLHRLVRRRPLSPGLDPWFEACPEAGYAAGTAVTCLIKRADELHRHAPTLRLTLCEPFGGPSDLWTPSSPRWLTREDRWPRWLRRTLGTRVLLVLEKWGSSGDV